jgi:hypothetical protein
VPTVRWAKGSGTLFVSPKKGGFVSLLHPNVADDKTESKNEMLKFCPTPCNNHAKKLAQFLLMQEACQLIKLKFCPIK